LTAHSSLAQRRRACLVFFDESALSLTPNLRRTWAPVDRPPTLTHPFNWKKASMAAALCYGVRGGGAQLAFHVQAGNYDTDTLIRVLDQLRRFLGGEKATLLWDGLPAHRSTAMRAWLATQWSWLVVERLPAYAPDLNPVEGLWSSLKAVELANLTSPTLAEVIQQAHRGIERVRRTPPPGLLIPAPCRPVGHMTLNPTPKSLPWVADGRPTSACGRTG
jgi:transposase